MKLKLDAEGRAVLTDGKPVYVHDDGKEVPFDAPTTVATITRLNGEAKAHREAKESAEEKLKAFAGIDDPAAALRALETIKNVDEGKLLTAGKVEEIKTAAKRAAEEQVAAANKTNAESLKAAEGERDKIRSLYDGEKLSGAFKGSKLIADKFVIPADLAQARFGNHFKNEDGKLVAYDPSGNKVFSRARPGEIADFDEALETLVDQYPYRDKILKGTGSSGSGAQAGNGGGSGSKSISRTEFAGLPAAEQAARAKPGSGYVIVD